MKDGNVLDDAALKTLGELVELEMSQEHRAALKPVFNYLVAPRLRALDDVELGDTPLAHSFDARWRDNND